MRRAGLSRPFLFAHGGYEAQRIRRGEPKVDATAGKDEGLSRKGQSTP